jgi:hypothetical protein
MRNETLEMLNKMKLEKMKRRTKTHKIFDDAELWTNPPEPSPLPFSAAAIIAATLLR